MALSWAAAASAQTVVVNTTSFLVTGDTTSVSALNATPGFENEISLWEAFTAANNTGGAGAVRIELAPGLTIPLGLSPLPALTRDNVELAGDGTNGFSTVAVGNIVINGASGIAVRDLRFDGLFSALRLESVDGGFIEGCVFGGIAPNISSIVLNNCQNVVVGGAGAGQGNVVINDVIGGIAVEGGSGNVIEGNLVGTDAVGTTGLGCAEGISILNSASGTIVRGNTVAGNSQFGISLANGAAGTSVVGNRVGVGPDGVTALGNGVGINIDLASVSSVVGGPNPGDANVIAHNTTAGVVVDGAAASGHTLRGNVIFANGSGASADAVHLLNGANNGLTAPVLSAVSPVAAGSAAPGSTVDLYADTPGGQARTYLETVTANAGSGLFAGSIALDTSVYEGRNITAMATLGADSSALATALPVAATAPTVVTITRTDAQNPTNLAEVGFEIEFSEAVSGIETGTGISSNDFTLVDNVGAAIAAVSGSGTTYQVTVETGTGDGSIRLDVLSGGGIEDVAGLPMAADYSSGPAYTMLRLKLLADLAEPGVVNEGDNVSLSVQAEGPGDLAYQWYKDNGSKAPVPLGPDAPTLAFTPAVPGDTGDYYVEVSAGPETVASSTVTLTVTPTVGMPAAGLAGLAMLAATLATAALRRRGRG
jgi:parallel beta-helix repeat protein